MSNKSVGEILTAFFNLAKTNPGALAQFLDDQDLLAKAEGHVPHAAHGAPRHVEDEFSRHGRPPSQEEIKTGPSFGASGGRHGAEFVNEHYGEHQQQHQVIIEAAEHIDRLLKNTADGLTTLRDELSAENQEKWADGIDAALTDIAKRRSGLRRILNAGEEAKEPPTISTAQFFETVLAGFGGIRPQDAALIKSQQLPATILAKAGNPDFEVAIVKSLNERCNSGILSSTDVFIGQNALGIYDKISKGLGPYTDKAASLKHWWRGMPSGVKECFAQHLPNVEALVAGL